MHHIRPDQTILPLTRPHSTRATVHNASDQTTHQQTKHNRRQTSLKACHTSSKLSAHRSQSNQVTTTESVVWHRMHSVSTAHTAYLDVKKQLFVSDHYQSVTSRLETSRYRDFSHFFESIGLGLEKKSRYWSRKYLDPKKSLGIGLENIWSRKKVSVFVSKNLV